MSEAQVSSPLDHAQLEQASLGDVAFAKELLAEFLGSAGDMLSSLASAVATGDAGQAFRSAHTLKGCCWTIGARALGNECERLEREARRGELEGAADMVKRIDEQFAQLEAYVRGRWQL